MAGLSVGQVVVSKQGKDVETVYAVVGFEGRGSEERVLLADMERFNVTRPKRKNPKHLQPTRHIIEEVRQKVAESRDIDKGRFIYLLQSSEQKGRLVHV